MRTKLSWTDSVMLSFRSEEKSSKFLTFQSLLLCDETIFSDIETGKIDRLNNPIKRAPHTLQQIFSSGWDRPYTREEAAFPAPFVRYVVSKSVMKWSMIYVIGLMPNCGPVLEG